MDEVSELSKCIHGKTAPCAASCPYGLDIRAFLAKIQRGSFGPAYNVLRSALVFPEIVCELCAAPCLEKCACNMDDKPVDLPLLERSAIEFTRNREPARYTIPEQTKKVAIVGGNLSGLTIALRLAEKRYKVTLFEKKNALCSSLSGRINEDILQEGLSLQFAYAPYELQLETEIKDIGPLLKDQDAVVLACGVDLAGENEKLFRCRNVEDVNHEIPEGIQMYNDVLWYLQTGRYRDAEPASPSTDFTVAHSTIPEPVRPENGSSFSKGEARQEAARCISCDCNACAEHCVMLRQYGQSIPFLARDLGVSANIFGETQGHAAMRQIGSCTDCGLCKQVCPEHIDIGKAIMDVRDALFRHDTLPPAHHEYWLRDMAFANSEKASALYLPQENCQYMFFPGCQAGASDPRYVSVLYRRLLELYPDTALYLRCCSIPAKWAGDTKLFQRELSNIKETWEKHGRPTMLLLCPSCERTFHEYLPEIPLLSIYELNGIKPAGLPGLTRAAIFDPCSSRSFPEMQLAVRKITTNLGIETEELPASQRGAQCCSFGGHGYIVNPLFVNAQVEQGMAASSLPYINYCVNCRDIFAGRGKQCVHVLDLLLGINDLQRMPPSLMERRENRRQLKKELSNTYHLPYTEETPMKLKLTMSDLLRTKLNKELILDDDLATTILCSEEKERFLIDVETEHRIAHETIGYVTYWVEYTYVGEDVCEIFNAYTHRMNIVVGKGEAG